MEPKTLAKIVRALALALPLSACAAPNLVKCGPGIQAMALDNQTSILYEDGSNYINRLVERCQKVTELKPSYHVASY